MSARTNAFLFHIIWVQPSKAKLIISHPKSRKCPHSCGLGCPENRSKIGQARLLISIFTARSFSVLRRGIKRKLAFKIHQPVKVLKSQLILGNLIIPMGIIFAGIVGIVIFGGYTGQIRWKHAGGNEIEIIIKPPER
jgi:hypothetical protein